MRKVGAARNANASRRKKDETEEVRWAGPSGKLNATQMQALPRPYPPFGCVYAWLMAHLTFNQKLDARQGHVLN